MEKIFREGSETCKRIFFSEGKKRVRPMSEFEEFRAAIQTFRLEPPDEEELIRLR